MKQETFFSTAKGAYVSPKCDVTEIFAEGVLCSSFETPEEYADPYAW